LNLSTAVIPSGFDRPSTAAARLQSEMKKKQFLPTSDSEQVISAGIFIIKKHKNGGLFKLNKCALVEDFV